jgi:hypothetical protein
MWVKGGGACLAVEQKRFEQLLKQIKSIILRAVPRRNKLPVPHLTEYFLAVE